MTTPGTFRVRRFAAVAFFMTLGAAGLVLLDFSFPDARPPTTVESICGYVCLLVSWPLVAISVFMSHNDDPPLAVYILAWTSAGVFWAFIVELFIVMMRRMWPNHSPEPSAVNVTNSASRSPTQIGGGSSQNR